MPKDKEEKKSKKQILPARFLNTFAAKLTSGPDEFAKRREADPGRFLSDQELAEFSPRKKKKGAADELLKDKK